MSQMQGQSCATGQIELADERQASGYVERLQRFRRERFPVGTGQGYLSHTSPFAVGNGERRHRYILNSLRQ